MKIGFICRYPWFLQYGGAEIQALNYIKALQSQGVDCEFIDYYSRKNSYDIIHCIGLNLETETVITSAKRNENKVVLSPVFYLNKYKENQYKTVCKLSNYRFNAMHKLKNALDTCDMILPNSNEESRQIASLFSLKKEKIKVIRNGADDVFFKKNIHSKNGDKDYILCVSMIDERKNTLKLIKGFLLSNLPYRLILVGDFRSTNKSYIHDINKLIKNNKNIEHIGFVDNINILHDLYHNAKIHALPSALETPGLSTIEALATGTPCVVGDCKPVREYFENNVVYVNHRSESSIAEGLKFASSYQWSNGDLKKQVSQYTWPEIAKQLKSAYKTVLDKK